VLELLLDAHGVDVCASGASGLTPLQYAVINGHADIIRRLLSHRACGRVEEPEAALCFDRLFAACGGYAGAEPHEHVLDVLLEAGLAPPRDAVARHARAARGAGHVACARRLEVRGPVVRGLIRGCEGFGR
jgi:hypothetical protein